MSIATKLSELVANGCTITLAPGNGPVGPHPVANMGINLDGTRLAWVEMWPLDQSAGHTLEFDAATEDGMNINLNLFRAGSLVATVAPMEPSEEEDYNWRGWLKAEGETQWFRTELLGELLS